MSNQIIIETKWPHGGGISSYGISPYRMLGEVPSKPGCYIWLVRPRTKDDFLLSSQLFEHKSLHASVRGNIRLEYRGDLTKHIPNTIVLEDIIDESLFSDLYFAVGYPLYIGISNNLNSRLSTHKTCFEESLFKKRSLSTRSSIDSIIVEEDSDDESSQFGTRLANIWTPTMRTDILYVKYLILDKCRNCQDQCYAKNCLNDIKSRLRAAETYANSLFNPVFGRR